MTDQEKKDEGSAAVFAATTTRDFSRADVQYVRRKRSVAKHDAEGEDGELNIVPYLDILINLIMFLLIAQATLVSLGMINVNASSYASAASADDDEKPDQPQLKLTIGIASTGFFIAAKGGVLPGEEAPADGEKAEGDAEKKAAPTIKRLANGEYDFRTLGAKLRGIKTAFPATDNLYIAADETTPYEVIVKTLDASREDKKGSLFPNVAFTQLR